MSSNMFVFLLLVIGPMLAMVFMHRGGARMGGHGSHHGSRSEHDSVDHGEHPPVRGEMAPVTAGDARGKRERHGCH